MRTASTRTARLAASLAAVGALTLTTLPPASASAEVTHGSNAIHFTTPVSSGAASYVVFENISRADRCTPEMLAFEAGGPEPDAWPVGEVDLRTQFTETPTGRVIGSFNGNGLPVELWTITDEAQDPFGAPCLATEGSALFASGAGAARLIDTRATGEGSGAKSIQFSHTARLVDVTGQKWAFDQSATLVFLTPDGPPVVDRGDTTLTPVGRTTS